MISKERSPYVSNTQADHRLDKLRSGPVARFRKQPKTLSDDLLLGLQAPGVNLYNESMHQ